MKSTPPAVDPRKAEMALPPIDAPDAICQQTRAYTRAHSVVFLKTTEPYGGLSNMAGGFPLRVNDLRILTSEALYQACRFPHRPDLQRLIIAQRSPITAKMTGEPHLHSSRPDWNRVRVAIMRWCLRVKLAQHWKMFGELLRSTGDLPIVEQSWKDDFWGARPAVDGTLRGVNALGRLLMELRELVRRERRNSLLPVEPLPIPGFLLDGRPIGRIVVDQLDRSTLIHRRTATVTTQIASVPAAGQLPLTSTSMTADSSARDKIQ